MSASREKQLRQEKIGQPDPKTAREAQQRKQEKRSNILYGTIAVVFVIVALASLIWRSNIIERSATAATIDGEKYTAAEVNFFYQNAYRNFYNYNYYYMAYGLISLNTNADLKDQVLTDSDASMLGVEAGQTWHDYFVDQALDQMAAVQAALKQADEEGFTYPAGVQAQYEDNMDSLKASAAASNVSVDQYLAGTFGSTMTEKVYGEQMYRALKYDAYTSAYDDSLTYDNAALTAAYSADPNSYDKVAYESVTILGSAAGTTDADGNTVDPTDEEKDAAKQAAKDAADEMLAAYRNGKKLEPLADANEKATYNNNDGTIYSSGDVLSEWLFDDARKAGDSAVLESGTTYYVVVFHERFRDEYPTIDVRHILIQPAAGELSEGDEGYEEEQAQLNADAKAKAEDILAQWQAGEATEDSFAALAMENSSDGSKYDGGLYTQVYQGQMVTAFNDWCFDASRQPGDTAVVETTYGYHVMYFVGEDLPRWQAQVSDTLKNEDYAEWVTALTADVSIEKNDSGMKYVG